jgi:hypothetical protein
VRIHKDAGVHHALAFNDTFARPVTLHITKTDVLIALDASTDVVSRRFAIGDFHELI